MSLCHDRIFYTFTQKPDYLQQNALKWKQNDISVIKRAHERTASTKKRNNVNDKMQKSFIFIVMTLRDTFSSKQQRKTTDVDVRTHKHMQTS